MQRFWQNLNRKQRLMAVVVLVLAVLLLVRYSGLSSGELPLPATIRALEAERAELRERVRMLRLRRQKEDRVLAGIQALAAPFWEVERSRPEAVVPAEFQRLARENQVQVTSVREPRTREYLGLEHVREVEFAFQINGTMKEVSRLLTPLARVRPAFFWSQCTIRPDPPRAPKSVRLNGKLRALVLSAEATRFLAGEGVADGEGG